MSKDSRIPELQNLPETGLLRVNQILQFIPISRSSWWAGVNPADIRNLLNCPKERQFGNHRI